MIENKQTYHPCTLQPTVGMRGMCDLVQEPIPQHQNTEEESNSICTYVINLPDRKDRKESILHEFAGREEFDLHLFPAIQHKRGAVGLWKSITQIVREAKERSEEVVLICEDDHHFTSAYDAKIFTNSVYRAAEYGCHLLLGGIGNFRNLIPVDSHLMWVDWSWCTQFMVVYSTAYDTILRADFDEESDVADEFLSKILSNKLVFSPFISVQKDFGYSDVTKNNNWIGTISRYFEKSELLANMCIRVMDKYEDEKLRSKDISSPIYKTPFGSHNPIHVYAMNLPSRIDRRESILAQFENKSLFELEIVAPVEHPVASTSLWKSFVRIVSIEKGKDSDFFIFCEDDHSFTNNYSEKFLLESIENARNLGADLLSGGFSWLDTPIRVRKNLFWAKTFTGMQFTIVFKKFYSRILNSDINGNHTLDIYLSTLSHDIFVTFPYISSQREFGYSDVTEKNNSEGRVSSLFNRTERSLTLLNKVYTYYKS